MASFKEQYCKIKHLIISTHNPAKGLASFFAFNNISTIERFIGLLCKEPFFDQAITGIPFPQKTQQLGHCGSMPLFASKELDHALLWYVLVLRQNAKHINKFLDLKQQYDHAFLLGKSELCQNLLDQSHKHFGASLWEILNRISLTSEVSGLDSQKQLTKSVLSKLQPGSVQYYIISSFSRQCESNISVNTFLSSIELDYRRFITSGTYKDLCKYAKYKLNGYLFSDNFDFLTESTLAYFLCLDDKNSLIDRYISFTSILTSVLKNANPLLQSKFISHLPSLIEKITDPFLKNAYHLGQHKFPYFHSEGIDTICLALNAYSQGEYQMCIDFVAKLLINDIVYFSLVDVFAKSCVFLQKHVLIAPENCLLSNILLRLWQLYAQSGDILEIQKDLTKMLYTHLDTTWSKELLLILEKYSSHLYSIKAPEFASLYSGISLPSNIFSFSLQYLEKYMQQTPEFYSKSLTTIFARAIREKDITKIHSLPIDPIRKSKYIASLLLESDPQNALEYLKEIYNFPGNIANNLEITAMLIDAELLCNRLQNAMEYFVPTYFKNSNFIYIGHIDKIFSAIKSADSNVKSSILTPITCSIYFKYFAEKNARDDVMLSISYEEFLESKNVSRPSELLSGITQDNADIFHIYYFSEVCVPNVMDRSLAFTSSDDVLKERIVICTALVSLDPSYQEKYTEEIHQLTNRLMVQLTRREVETSKIYMDISGIKTLLLKKVSESYERYSLFRENDLNEQIIQILNSVNDSDSTCPPIYYIDIEPDTMLEEIVKQARDIFVADDKYGLDGYLSVRIRHGTLESQLRSCFEKLKLITTKALDETYQPNQFWYKSGQDSTRNCQIDQSFSDFSLKVDSAITHLKRNLIQIRTEDKNPEGLFDFSINQNDISAIKARLPLGTTFEEFEEVALDFFLDITENCLEKIRTSLQAEINEGFQDALNQLQTDLNGFAAEINLHRLGDQIATARTDISNELKTIAEWFRLTRPDSFQDYQLSLAASISCSIMESFSNIFTHDITNIDPQIKLKGSTLPSVVDIFKILLDNVIRHSGLSNNLRANIFAFRNQNQVTIRVDNPIASNSVDIEKMDTIISQLSNWENSGTINSEGGSGLYKIKKILSVDLQCASTISYLLENDTFSLSIEANLGGVLL